MSDNFIPLNQSTPVQERWQGRNQQINSQNNWPQRRNNRRSYNQNNHNRRGNNSNRSNASFVSDFNNSGYDNRNNIDAYLHPSMLQDPWAHLKQDREKNT